MPAPTPGPEARALLARHGALVESARGILDHLDGTTVQVADLVTTDREARVHTELAAIDIEALSSMTDRNLRLRALAEAGYRTAADLLDANPATLQAVPGVGEQTARGVLAAVDQVAEAVRSTLAFRIEVDRGARPDSCTTLQVVRLLHRLLRLNPLIEPHRRALVDLVSTTPLLRQATPAGNRLRWALTLPRARRAARHSLDALYHWDESIQTSGTPALLAELAAACAPPDPEPMALWDDFEHRAAHYYTLLHTIVPTAVDALAARGLLTTDLADRIADHPLDLSLMRTPLRGYQEFGTRFALNQGRALIGDEMGLGKTLQALAAIADRTSAGHHHFLVVCPAGLLINWLRETTRHTTMTAHRLHGPDRARAIDTWLADGGIGITTFEQLAHLPTSMADRLGLLVVDEAHYVKNPAAERSRRIATWTGAASRVLFLTGTPMDNYLDDFVALVRLLQPELADTFPAHLGLVGADTFRRTVAPVYLRRNQPDVLVELPDLVTVDEWEELSGPGERLYRQAVASGNFMAMRRAAYLTPDPGDSTKLDRLVEIVDEAGGNGHRTVVFSYFRDVIDTVVAAVGTRTVSPVYGPLTGDVPADQRQAIIDEFSAGPGDAVLVAQITAGGVGLNLQAASVAILCEPQLTPAAESQAIARLHRMGQTRPVVAHRLLAPDSVDERLIEILAGKTRVFNEYVRDSALAQHTVAAVDVTGSGVAHQVVAAEQARLGYGPVWDELAASGEAGD